MIRNSVCRRSTMLFFFAVATNSWAATYDAAASFEQGFLSKSNPNGVWSYGYSTSFTGPVSLYTQTSQPGGIGGTNSQSWSSGEKRLRLSSTMDQPKVIPANQGSVDVLANEIVLLPVGGQNADVVFTAPTGGTYSVTGSFRGDQQLIQVVLGIAANGSLLLSSSISSDGQIVPFTYTVSLSAGSTVVFSVQQVPGGVLIHWSYSSHYRPAGGPGSLLLFPPRRGRRFSDDPDVRQLLPSADHLRHQFLFRHRKPVVGPIQSRSGFDPHRYAAAWTIHP